MEKSNNYETCEFENCKNDPEYTCPCPNKQSSFCEAHITEHIRDQGYHGKVIENFMEISRSEKVNITIQCEAALIELKKIKEQIAFEANKGMKRIIEATVSNFEYVKQQEDTYKDIIGFFSISDRIIKRNEYSRKDKTILESLKNPESILENLKLKEKEMMAKVHYRTDQDFNDMVNSYSDQIEEIKKSIEKNNTTFIEEFEKIKQSASICIEHYINQIGLLLDNFGLKINPEYFNDKFISENMIHFKISENLNDYKILNFPKNFYDDTYKSKNLGFFNDNSKVFNIVDCLEQRTIKIDMNMDAPLWTWAGWYELSENKMLYYSGYNSTNKTCPTKIYIFDLESPQNFTTYDIEKGKGYTGSLGYYNNCIYCFAGLTSAGYIKNSGFYDLQKKEWKDIEALPEVCGHNSVVLSIDKLVVSGYNTTKAYVYDPKIDKYEAKGVFTVNHHKFLAKGNSLIFMFENGKIHETKEGEYNFTVVNGNSGVVNLALISYVLRNKVNLYFALHNRKLYKFNLITKVVQELRAL